MFYLLDYKLWLPVPTTLGIVFLVRVVFRSSLRRTANQRLAYWPDNLILLFCEYSQKLVRKDQLVIKSPRKKDKEWFCVIFSWMIKHLLLTAQIWWFYQLNKETTATDVHFPLGIQFDSQIQSIVHHHRAYHQIFRKLCWKKYYPIFKKFTKHKPFTTYTCPNSCAILNAPDK